MYRGWSGIHCKELVADVNRKGGQAINADIDTMTDLKLGTIHLDVTEG